MTPAVIAYTRRVLLDHHYQLVTRRQIAKQQLLASRATPFAVKTMADLDRDIDTNIEARAALERMAEREVA